ncbi:sister chromatid cohesion protein-like protein Dcc1 [Lophiostoma macrostomum CBS 122681]|uniref:Sister chromatid cohesion protein-like protein Dcc1 n=1 Tax=Lophiostoma macrostomum CBS 122681 TaxID=1314788 RepID=A0A6A6SMV9_9PLEO|nr:sister chromatid cohesion protein-like protein Dcc1 [Lophiostoma macrostomum CBS 122681]
MATQQDEGDVPFSVAHDMQQFRLLELPPEIVELIESANPPALSIKSRVPSTTPNASNASAAHAVLCTANKTFQLRQVQTSNSLFVTQPVLESHNNEIPTPTTRAIASCAVTLELHPSDENPRIYLEEALPLYDIVDGEVEAAGNGKNKASIFADVPVSDGQAERCWSELVAFEFSGSSYRPSANTLSQIWKSINAAAVAEGIKLDSQFLADDMTKVADEEGYPVALVQALLKRRLSTDNQDINGPWACLDRPRTVQFVGQMLLEARRESDDYLTAGFLDTWKDGLPEAWRGDAVLKVIDGKYELPSSTTIRAKARSGTSSKEDNTASKGSSSRKWHAKFGRARKK